MSLVSVGVVLSRWEYDSPWTGQCDSAQVTETQQKLVVYTTELTGVSRVRAFCAIARLEVRTHDVGVYASQEMVKDTTLSNTRLRHCAWVSSFHTLFNTLLPPLPSLKSLKGGGGGGSPRMHLAVAGSRSRRFKR